MRGQTVYVYFMSVEAFLLNGLDTHNIIGYSAGFIPATCDFHVGGRDLLKM